MKTAGVDVAEDINKRSISREKQEISSTTTSSHVQEDLFPQQPGSSITSASGEEDGSFIPRLVNFGTRTVQDTASPSRPGEIGRGQQSSTGDDKKSSKILLENREKKNTKRNKMKAFYSPVKEQRKAMERVVSLSGRLFLGHMRRMAKDYEARLLASSSSAAGGDGTRTGTTGAGINNAGAHLKPGEGGLSPTDEATTLIHLVDQVVKITHPKKHFPLPPLLSAHQRIERSKIKASSKTSSRTGGTGGAARSRDKGSAENIKKVKPDFDLHHRQQGAHRDHRKNREDHPREEQDREHHQHRFHRDDQEVEEQELYRTISMRASELFVHPTRKRFCTQETVLRAARAAAKSTIEFVLKLAKLARIGHGIHSTSSSSPSTSSSSSSGGGLRTSRPRSSPGAPPGPGTMSDFIVNVEKILNSDMKNSILKQQGSTSTGAAGGAGGAGGGSSSSTSTSSSGTKENTIALAFQRAQASLLSTKPHTLNPGEEIPFEFPMVHESDWSGREQQFAWSNMGGPGNHWENPRSGMGMANNNKYLFEVQRIFDSASRGALEDFTLGDGEKPLVSVEAELNERTLSHINHPDETLYRDIGVNFLRERPMDGKKHPELELIPENRRVKRPATVRFLRNPHPEPSLGFLKREIIEISGRGEP